MRKAIMAIWCLCFCGMQWRAIGQLCDIRAMATIPTLKVHFGRN